VAGPNPNPPQPGEQRPISISVTEDRLESADGRFWDEAKITLELRNDHVDSELECQVSASHEVLGDASLRVISLTECQLLNDVGAVLATGTPPVLQLTLVKGDKKAFRVRAAVDDVAVTRMRVAVEEIQ
jgi:hypothetical protein